MTAGRGILPAMAQICPTIMQNPLFLLFHILPMAYIHLTASFIAGVTSVPATMRMAPQTVLLFVFLEQLRINFGYYDNDSPCFKAKKNYF